MQAAYIVVASSETSSKGGKSFVNLQRSAGTKNVVVEWREQEGLSP